jgi:putative membrane protein
MDDPASKAASTTVELARERNRQAADRTLMAWIRTSLAMISLGFGIERFGQATVSLSATTDGFSPLKTTFFGAALIMLGIVATIAGILEHASVVAAIARDDYRYGDRPPIARMMGWAVVGVGSAALVAVFWM